MEDAIRHAGEAASPVARRFALTWFAKGVEDGGGTARLRWWQSWCCGPRDALTATLVATTLEVLEPAGCDDAAAAAGLK